MHQKADKVHVDQSIEIILLGVERIDVIVKLHTEEFIILLIFTGLYRKLFIYCTCTVKYTSEHEGQMHNWMP